MSRPPAAGASGRPRHNPNASRQQPEPPGLAARRVAVRLVDGVLSRARALDAALEAEHDPSGFRALDPRDRALARAIAGATLRRFGTLRGLIAARLETGMPKKSGPLEAILATAAAQLLYLDVPAHAAVDLAVQSARADPDARRYAALVNAVLRGISKDGAPESRPGADLPGWLYQRWENAYGPDVAARIAETLHHEAALDLTVKSDPQGWAERLGGATLPTGGVRIAAGGMVPDLAGFSDGAWWVQDAAAAIPVRLFGDLRNKQAIDLCAAPGGKTAQLAAAGAEVTAVDKSAERLTRLNQNLSRLKLRAAARVGDAATVSLEPADAVLLDAPCSATGTLRRHPDVAWMRRESDIASLVRVQAQLLDAAVKAVKPGGLLVYGVCSLEPEEGERQIAGLVARNPRVRVERVEPSELPGLEDAIDDEGCVRTLPSHLSNDDPKLGGLDGFFAARLRVG